MGKKRCKLSDFGTFISRWNFLYGVAVIYAGFLLVYWVLEAFSFYEQNAKICF
jgi:hypothetical protein